jgi:glycosyltransferase involved in cell wall biosynthesis
MQRVAFTLIGGKAWTGGYNYLLNLVTLLTQHANSRIEPVLFFGTDTTDDEVAPFAALNGATVIRSSLMNQNRRNISLARSVLLGGDADVTALFKSQRISVLFEAARFFGKNIGIPTVAWIPDFQHRRLRHLFGTLDYWKRELGFRAQVASGRRFMLSSNDAEADCRTFYPATTGRTNVASFAVRAPTPMSLSEARAIASRYGMPQHFFFLPNQFWRHKNHELVVSALEKLRARSQFVVIAASGKQLDPRDASYVPSLLQRVRESALCDMFRPLGLIPYRDLIGLMVASQALLNPSLFEGWSTTVEEARALGVSMILSDIGVHREQAAEGAVYFDPLSADSLVEALESLPRLDDGAREAFAAAARVDNERRVLNFVENFVRIVERSPLSDPML